jgi:hypothetical protein
MATRRGCLLLCTLAAATGWSRASHADEIDRCLTAHTQAQRLRQDGKLRASREQLLVCARTSCPNVVRAECGEWLGEVLALLPTVVIAARAADGTDLAEVRVTVDREPVLSHLDGRELELDPGLHTLRLEASGFEPAEQTIVVREREKARALAFTMPKVTTSLPAARSLPPGGNNEARPVPVVVYGLGALGIAALGSFAYFGLSGRAEYFDLKDRCGPGCTSSDVAPMRTRLLLADVSLGVSVVALAAASLLYFTRPIVRDVRASNATARLGVDVRAEAHRATATATWVF